MSDALPASAQRIQEALRAKGYSNQVTEMPESTRTAADAAAACGCTVAQIAKSIVFKAPEGDPVLVIASGVNRVDTGKVGALLGARPGKADADFVRSSTGYAIGGVPPLGHAGPVRILIDADLMKFDEIWAAAGTPKCVFKLAPSELEAMTGGTVADIRVDEERATEGA